MKIKRILYTIQYLYLMKTQSGIHSKDLRHSLPMKVVALQKNK